MGPPEAPWDVQWEVPWNVPWDVPCDAPWNVPWDTKWEVPWDVPWDVPKPYKRRTSGRTTRMLFSGYPCSGNANMALPLLGSLRLEEAFFLLARRRCALRSFHKYTWPDLVPSQTPWKSTESYRHFSTLRYRYRYTAPSGTAQGHHTRAAQGPRTRAPAQGLCTKLRTVPSPCEYALVRLQRVYRW